ncbi:MAG: response regulator [Chloroflexi bacterium]|nr:response regulator [Chloroflexota bacterium]
MANPDLLLLALEDQQIRSLFERALSASGHQIAAAQDRVSLNRILQDTFPALLILSATFQGETGLEIAQTLLERFPTLPVLYFLTSDNPALIKQALHIGVSDCLVSPLKVEDINRAVTNSLKRASRIGDWTRREVRRTTASLKQKLDELQKLEIILNGIADGVMILDMDGKILMINPVVRRAFGLSDTDFTGRPVLEVVPHPDLRSLLATGADNPLPVHEITFDDGRVYNGQYAPIAGIGTAVTMQDISYIKQVDRLRSEFVHTVSHDLRSPLTAVLGYVELLGRIGPLNEQQREFVQRIQNSVQNITALVNDLLDLGRIEAGMDIRREVIPLDGIINYTLEHLNPQIQEKNQRVQVDLPASIPSFRGNPIRLRQMLDNLVNNAIKYTPDGGEIRIQLEQQGDLAILCISDSGPGIPPLDQPHVFEKFYRASNVPKGVGGSGLGLAIVKSIVENHQGRIWVESALGKGTKFSVMLPIHGEEKKSVGKA